MASNNRTFAIIGCGCLGLIAIVVVSVLTLGYGLFSLLKGSEPYQESLARVQNHPAAIAAMGTPIEPGFFVTGNVNLENQAGDADISYQVSGPNGEAEISVAAERAGGKWEYRTMTATLGSSGEILDLLASP
ncbi:MAG: hypothetical protein KDN20_04405 [Verrucomicrobiae bacterium]|nr:hypothetical protein [Verrucomicrobiae bacterium]